MPRNVGSADRVIRTVLAIALLAVGLGVIQGFVGVLMAVVAVVFLVTATLGSCPIYTVLGLRTCPMRSATGR